MNNQITQRMLCHVCDARMRGGLPPLRECERCGGDGTATKVPTCQKCKEREGWTTVAEEALRAINGYLGINPDSPTEVTIQTLRELIDKADANARELGELQRKRPMTEAEEKLVGTALAVEFGIQDCCSNDTLVSLRGALQVATLAVLAERKPPEPRPITPEELAVVEAAEEWWYFTGNHLEKSSSGDDTARGDLQRAVRELCAKRKGQ